MARLNSPKETLSRVIFTNYNDRRYLQEITKFDNMNSRNARTSQSSISKPVYYFKAEISMLGQSEKEGI
jgi:hypothetical protein